MSRYASHEWHPIAGTQTGSYTSGPRKLVLHTTEGGLQGALAAYASKRVVPHFTWDRASRRRLQHVDTQHSVSALANDLGGVQTNRDSAIQVEITGFAADSHNWSDDDLRWIADGIRELCKVEVIDWRSYKTFVGQEAGMIATEDAPQRMTFAEWDAFGGVCGHQHVPENEHWDPGRLNYPRILGYIEEDDMTPDDLKAAVRAVLNEGTAKGQTSWAGTSRATLASIQAVYNVVTDADALAQKVADRLSTVDVAKETVKAAVRESFAEAFAGASG